MLPYKKLIGVAIFAFLSLISYGQSEKDLIKESKSLFKQKNYLQAKESYLKLLSINSLSSEYNYFYGLCLYFDGNTNQALKHLSYVSELNDAKAEYHYYFGRALHSNYQYPLHQHCYLSSTSSDHFLREGVWLMGLLYLLLQTLLKQFGKKIS